MLSGNPLFTSASAKASAFENKEAVELWIAFKNTDRIYPLYDEVRAEKGDYRAMKIGCSFITE
jgi:hypothetical protein